MATPLRRGRNILPISDVLSRLAGHGFELIDPSTYTGNRYPIACRRIACGHELEFRLSHLPHQSKDCRTCARTTATAAADHANAALKAAGCQSMEPYPRYPNAPWRVRRRLCGHAIITTATALAALDSTVACRTCQALTHVPMAAARDSLDYKPAIQTMINAGRVPLDPYPGAGLPWRSLCTRCGSETTPRLASIRTGSGCAVCVTWTKAARTGSRTKDSPYDAIRRSITLLHNHRLDLVPSGPATPDGPWHVEHRLCGHSETLAMPDLLTAVDRCPNCRTIARNQQPYESKPPRTPARATTVRPVVRHGPSSSGTARARIAAADLEPVGPGPDRPDGPWRVRHQSCGRIVTLPIRQLLSSTKNCTGCQAMQRLNE